MYSTNCHPASETFVLLVEGSVYVLAPTIQNSGDRCGPVRPRRSTADLFHEKWGEVKFRSGNKSMVDWLLIRAPSDLAQGAD